MARTIAEIKQEMTDAYVQESAVREKYGLGQNGTIDFSKVSIEGLLFYVVAFGIWVLEKLFDTHREEVSTALAEKTPHTARWYRNKVLEFVPGWAGGAAPVKWCSVDDRGCRLKVKVAAGEAGARTQVTASGGSPVETAVEALENYLEQEKDAGIKIEVVNLAGDVLKANLTVWYDPIAFVPGTVDTALKAYVQNLDFDGLLSRNGIIDALRQVPGVEMVHIDSLQSKAAAATVLHTFLEQERANAGYWTIANGDINITYIRYRSENL